MFTLLRGHLRTSSTPGSPDIEQAQSLSPSIRGSDQSQQAIRPSSELPRQSSGRSFIKEQPGPLPRASTAEHEGQLSTNDNHELSTSDRLGSIEQRPPDVTHTASSLEPLSNGQLPSLSAVSEKVQRPIYSSMQSAPAAQFQYLHNQAHSSTLDSQLSSTASLQVPKGSRPGTDRRTVSTTLASPPAQSGSNFSAYEIPVSKSRTKLNLLNPMSLLARRRTSQTIPHLLATPNVALPQQHSPLETHDPRIRGTRVHDFSAPRARPPQSHDNFQARGLPSVSAASTAYSENTHPLEARLSTDGVGQSPIPGTSDAAQPFNHLAQSKPPKTPFDRDYLSKELPPPPLDSEAEDEITHQRQSEETSVDRPFSLDSIGPGVEEPLKNGDDFPLEESVGLLSITNQTSLHRRSSRREDGLDGKRSTAGPRHSKSNSSRFSFDMIGAASQERLLEDRHREKALKSETAAADVDATNFMQDDEDDVDYEAMMDDDGFEEPIPMIDEDSMNQFSTATPLMRELESSESWRDVLPTRESPGMSAISAQLSPVHDVNKNETIDQDGDSSEVMTCSATVENLPGQAVTCASLSLDALLEANGLGLTGVDFGDRRDQNLPKSISTQTITQAAFEEDDMYFDDGEIGHLEDTHDEIQFDESIFDKEDTDEFGRPLQPPSSIYTTITASSNPTVVPDPAIRPETFQMRTSLLNAADGESCVDNAGYAEIQEQSSLEHRTMGLNQETFGLTQDKLVAYQSALAAAAHAAAADGRFRRESTPSVRFDDELIEYGDEFSREEETDGDFNFDDSYEDDDIIAAANAEALAVDNEGFYSQEFGFYSKPMGGAGQYANGGFFGPRGADGLHRSHSGRGREPNLTPITERSEYSNRNSIMSLPQLATGSLPMSSPGLAQLASMINDEDDESMSLESLQRLRRDAWGRNSSPRPGSSSSNVVQGASFSDENLGSSHFAHIPWQQTNLMSSSPAAPYVPWQNNSLASASFREMGNSETETAGDHDIGAKRHRHTSSSDSISYLREEDPVQGERWILERRRTGDDGESEVFGREVITGGRI